LGLRAGAHPPAGRDRRPRPVAVRPRPAGAPARIGRRLRAGGARADRRAATRSGRGLGDRSLASRIVNAAPPPESAPERRWRIRRMPGAPLVAVRVVLAGGARAEPAPGVALIAGR